MAEAKRETTRNSGGGVHEILCPCPRQDTTDLIEGTLRLLENRLPQPLPFSPSPRVIQKTRPRLRRGWLGLIR